LHTRVKIWGKKCTISHVIKKRKSLAKILPPPNFLHTRVKIWGKKKRKSKKKILKKIKKKYFLTYLQPPMAHLKITFWKKKLTGWLSYWPQKGLKSTFWAIYPVLSVAISLRKILVSPWLISNFCYFWCTVVRWREMYVFFRK
jgi:hypothetical protein